MRDKNVESILFVCLGNICRSPLAEGIARELLKTREEAIRIDSAGTGGWHIGEPPCERSIDIAKKYGIDISNQRARSVNPYDREMFDIVVAMDSSNYYDLIRIKGFSEDRVFKLGDFGFDGKDVPDPYFFEGNKGFDLVFDMIHRGVEEMFVKYGLK